MEENAAMLCCEVAQEPAGLILLRSSQLHLKNFIKASLTIEIAHWRKGGVVLTAIHYHWIEKYLSTFNITMIIYYLYYS